MPFDSSLNSAYLTSRFGEDPLPTLITAPKTRGRGFDTEFVQPDIRIKLPFPTESLQSFVMQILGAPGNVQILNEASGAGGSSTSGTSTSVASSGRAGQGPQMQWYMQGANPGIFGEMPLGFAYASSASASVPTQITLWPPDPSALFVTNSTAPMGGPPTFTAAMTWQTPTQAAQAAAAEVVLANPHPSFPNGFTIVNGAGTTAGQDGGAKEVYLDVNTQMSVDLDGLGIKLLNDETSPGNHEFYGTDGSGTKGWFTQHIITPVVTETRNTILVDASNAVGVRLLADTITAATLAEFIRCEHETGETAFYIEFGASGSDSSMVIGNATSGVNSTVTCYSQMSVYQTFTVLGDLFLGTAGSGIYIKEGSNAMCGVATMTAGTVTVNTTKVTANSRILLTVQSLGTVTVPTPVAVTARVNATSFTITSADNTDTSVVAWVIVGGIP